MYDGGLVLERYNWLGSMLKPFPILLLDECPRSSNEQRGKTHGSFAVAIGAILQLLHAPRRDGLIHNNHPVAARSGSAEQVVATLSRLGGVCWSDLLASARSQAPVCSPRADGLSVVRYRTRDDRLCYRCRRFPARLSIAAGQGIRGPKI
ncbi:hypothetical protein M433DRAFT_147955 [Acidomyces richmondensis BFW]|nr:MAG: hypothetical protein FE78DRAFT_77502 [Acidomyces sp. 'richmondensis']KYG41078.1 hypothetical protein M433DRAFT_147955 [Acidomyces richmondensis BFW]